MGEQRSQANILGSQYSSDEARRNDRPSSFNSRRRSVVDSFKEVLLLAGEHQSSSVEEQKSQILQFIQTHAPKDAEIFRRFLAQPQGQGDGISQGELTRIVGIFKTITDKEVVGGPLAGVFRDPANRAELILSMIRMLDDRNGQINQGRLNTCGAASTNIALLGAKQDELVRLVSGLMDGHDEETGISVPSDIAAAIGKGGYRELSAQILHAAFMNAATDNNYSAGTDMVKRDWLAKIDGTRLYQGGLFEFETKRLLQLVHGNRQAVKTWGDLEGEEADLAFNSVKKALAENRPVLASANNLHVINAQTGVEIDGGRHLVAIVGVKGNDIIFRDTRGSDYPLDLRRTPGIVIEDANRNTWKVDKDTFFKSYANFILEVKPEDPQVSKDPDFVKDYDYSKTWEMREGYKTTTEITSECRPDGYKTSQPFLSKRGDEGDGEWWRRETQRILESVKRRGTSEPADLHKPRKLENV